MIEDDTPPRSRGSRGGAHRAQRKQARWRRSGARPARSDDTRPAETAGARVGTETATGLTGPAGSARTELAGLDTGARTGLADVETAGAGRPGLPAAGVVSEPHVAPESVAPADPGSAAPGASEAPAGLIIAAGTGTRVAAPSATAPADASKIARSRTGGPTGGRFAPGSRSRGILIRVSAVVVAAGIVGVGLVRPGVPAAEPTVTQFLLAWKSRHYLAAAELTTGNPRKVAAELASAYERLDASNLDLTMRGVSQQGKVATASFEASFDLAGSGLTWSYPNSFRLTDGRGGWRVLWSPSVIVPGMTSREQLAVVSSWNHRSQVLDSAGQPLTVPSKVYQVGVVPGDLAHPDQTADALATATGLSESQVAGQMAQGLSDDFLALLTLSPGEYSQLRGKLSKIPGLRIRQRTERLFDSIAPDVVGSVGTETASVLRVDGQEYRPGTTVGLSGLQQAFNPRLVGTPRTDVVLQQAGLPARDLKTWPGSAGTPVRTTLNATVQLAADQALSQLPTSAAIVAVQPSTGKILAVASHNQRGMPSLNPLAGQYEPGQAFSFVSSAAILSAEKLSLADPVPCPDSNSVDGRVFRNNPPVTGLGATPSFRADFTHACSTAFAGGLALSLTAKELAKASREFGIGGWQLPVSQYFAGTIGQPASAGQLAADLIGAGQVRVSPLGMALAAGVLEAGKWRTPSLVVGSDTSSVSRSAASLQVLAQLRTLMGEAASTGSNSVADIGGGVYGQVGSGHYPSGHRWLNWFVGYRGDVAFAVVELGTSASASASALAGSFLQNVQAGS